MHDVTPDSTAPAAYRLSLILPAWNEEAVIAQAIEEAVAALSRVTGEFEVIVVDDGSTDRTAEIAEACGVDDRRVRLVRLSANCGYGAALRAGFNSARLDLVAFTDADCQFELGALAYMLPLTAQHDIVSGYRMHRQDAAARRFYSWGYNTLIQGLLGSELRDVDCALKVFHRDQLPSIEPASNGYFANTEMMTIARLQGRSTIEVGVRHRPRAAGRSKVTLREVPRVLAALLPFWWRVVMFPASDSVAASVHDKRQFWLALLLLMIVSAALLFPNLAYPLIEPDEGRYAEIAREMLSRGDWIVPRFQKQAYLDKPPLFYWLCAGSYALFGPHEWSARLVPALAAWCTVLTTFGFGSRLCGVRAALLGSLTMTLSFGFVSCGRFLVLDSLLALLVSGSLFTAHAAVSGTRFRWGYWLVSAVLCGLGVLTKGPVAFALLAPPTIVHVWLSRERGMRQVRKWSIYAAVTAGISLPWYLLVLEQAPGFFHHFVWTHHIQRFLSGSNHAEPMWFYLPVLFLSCMPWGLLLFPLLKYLVSPHRHIRNRQSASIGFLVLWSGWCLLFFSASRGKLPTYILPAIPAVMLLLGHYVHECCSPFAATVCSRVRAHAVFHRGILALSGAGMIGSGCLLLAGLNGRLQTFVEVFVWGALLLTALAACHRLAPRAVFAVFCATAFAVTAKLAHDIFPTWAAQRSLVYASQQNGESLSTIDRSSALACVAGEWGSIPFVLGRDDVMKFPEVDAAAIRTYLAQHPASLLVIDDDLTATQVAALLPAQAQVRTLAATPKGSLLKVTIPEQSLPRIQLMSAELSGGTAVR